MKNNDLNLRFGPGSNSGFTPAGIAAFDNLHPAAVVRELIQNSLDAARAASNIPAVVRFIVTREPLDTIPCIGVYSNTLKRAVKCQRGSMGASADLVVSRIGKSLGNKEVDVLSILDNGIGLDDGRMSALLSDGVSLKDKDSAGTYGNGHSTAIPASDLRYILYGGIGGNGDRICSGHAVLASHLKDGKKTLAFRRWLFD